MRCPRCTFYLTQMIHDGVEIDHCDRCRGTFLDRGEAGALFGSTVEPEAWKDAWPTKDLGPTKLSCPRDHHKLNGHLVTFKKDNVQVDTCPHCEGLWVDAHEAVKLRMLIEAAHTEADRKSSGLDKPGVGSYLFQLFTGMPIEAWNPIRNPPVVMRTLVGLLCALYVLQVIFGEAFHAVPGALMMVPAEIVRGEHLWTIVTYGFFHNGIAHLAGNLYFLWIFGDNIEDSLGRPRFLFLYGAALVAGGLLHMASDGQSTLPMLGASGAIAGLMGAYIVLFAKVRLYVVVLIFRVRIPAMAYLGIWIAIQLAMVATGATGVAWMAHIGGFVAGAIIAFGFKDEARYSALKSTQSQNGATAVKAG